MDINFHDLSSEAKMLLKGNRRINVADRYFLEKIALLGELEDGGYISPCSADEETLRSIRAELRNELYADDKY